MAFLSAFCFGASPVLYRLGLKDRPAIHGNVIRSLFSLMVSSVLLLLVRPYFNPLFKVEGLLVVLVLTLVGPLTADTLYLYSISKIGASKAAPLGYAYAFVAAFLGAVLFGEEVRALELASGALILAGVWILYHRAVDEGGASSGAKKGVAAILTSAVLWGFSAVLIKLALLYVDVILLVFLRSVFLSLALLAIVLARGDLGKLLAFDLRDSLFMGIGGSLGIVVGIVAFSYSLYFVGVGKASLITTFAPFVTLVLSKKIERVGAGVALATALIVVGNAVLILF